MKRYAVISQVFAFAFYVSCRDAVKPGTRVYPLADPAMETAVLGVQAPGDPVITIYLTIDDGPSAASPFIDSMSQAWQARINVLLIGGRLTDFEKEWSRYNVNPQVEIANHSFSHASGHYRKYYRNGQEVDADIVFNQDLLGLQHKIARLPGRNTWRIDGLRKQISEMQTMLQTCWLVMDTGCSDGISSGRLLPAPIRLSCRQRIFCTV